MGNRAVTFSPPLFNTSKPTHGVAYSVPGLKSLVVLNGLV